MRTPGTFVLASLVGLIPARAFAHPSHGSGGQVRDHRSGSSGGGGHGGSEVRDHRGGGGRSSGGVVRDHRSHCCRGGDDVVVDEAADDAVDVASALFGDGQDDGVVHVERGPAITIELGGLAGRFRGPSLSRTGTLTMNGSSFDYGLDSGPASAGDTGAGAAELRVTVSEWPHLYAGGELAFGGLSRSPIHLMSSSPDLAITSQALLGLDGLAGARVRAGRVELDAEVAGGLRAIATTINTLDATDDDSGAAEVGVSPVLEGRLRAALWLAPHLFVSAQVGAGALDRSDVSLAFAIGTSTRAFAEPVTPPLR